MANPILSRDQFTFKYGGNQVGALTDVSYTIDGNVIEANNFDTGQITNALIGRKTVTISCDFETDREDADGQNQIRTDFLDSTKREASDFSDWNIEAPTTASGDVTFSGSGIVTNYSESGGDDGDGLVTGSFEIRVTSFTESTAT